MGARLMRRIPAVVALSEWEAAELVASSESAPNLARKYGISVRSVFKYRSRTVKCVHCERRFYTKGAAWDHLFESETA